MMERSHVQCREVQYYHDMKHDVPGFPEQYLEMGSLEFAKKLILDANVAVSPGIGFGQYGDDHVRFALIENEHRTRQALRNIKRLFRVESTMTQTF